jgi:hypothetical protein
VVDLDVAAAANQRLEEVTEELAAYAEQVSARNLPARSQG